MGCFGTPQPRDSLCAFDLISLTIKDEVEFWSCDCIVKETVWNRPEKVDHLAYKNLCVLQGSGIIKMIRNLAKLQTLYTERCIWDYTNTWRKKPAPPPIFTMLHAYLEYEGI